MPAKPAGAQRLAQQQHRQRERGQRLAQRERHAGGRRDEAQRGAEQQVRHARGDHAQPGDDQPAARARRRPGRRRPTARSPTPPAARSAPPCRTPTGSRARATRAWTATWPSACRPRTRSPPPGTAAGRRVGPARRRRCPARWPRRRRSPAPCPATTAPTGAPTRDQRLQRAGEQRPAADRDRRAHRDAGQPHAGEEREVVDGDGRAGEQLAAPQARRRGRARARRARWRPPATRRTAAAIARRSAPIQYGDRCAPAKCWDVPVVPHSTAADSARTMPGQDAVFMRPSWRAAAPRFCRETLDLQARPRRPRTPIARSRRSACASALADAIADARGGRLQRQAAPQQPLRLVQPQRAQPGLRRLAGELQQPRVEALRAQQAAFGHAGGRPRLVQRAGERGLQAVERDAAAHAGARRAEDGRPAGRSRRALGRPGARTPAVTAKRRARSRPRAGGHVDHHHAQVGRGGVGVGDAGGDDQAAGVVREVGRRADLDVHAAAPGEQHLRVVVRVHGLLAAVRADAQLRLERASRSDMRQSRARSRRRGIIRHSVPPRTRRPVPPPART